MKSSNHILNELQGIAPVLSQLDKVNFYQVDENYFAESGVKIMGMIESSPVLAGMKKKELYVAPSQSYFGTFSDGLINRIHADDVAEELSYTIPVLQHVAKKELYKVPALYFDGLPDKIIRIVSKEIVEHASVVDHWSDKWSLALQKVFGFFSRPRYSFALASVVGMIVCFALVMNNKTLSADDKIFAQMQQVSDADLHHYIAKHTDEFDEHILLHDINNVEFTHYFDKPEQVTPHIEGHINGKQDKEDEITSEDILD